MTAKLLQVELAISAPWSVGAVDFDEAAKLLTVPVDFKPGTRFKVWKVNDAPLTICDGRTDPMRRFTTCCRSSE